MHAIQKGVYLVICEILIYGGGGGKFLWRIEIELTGENCYTNI